MCPRLHLSTTAAENAMSVQDSASPMAHAIPGARPAAGSAQLVLLTLVGLLAWAGAQWQQQQGSGAVAAAALERLQRPVPPARAGALVAVADLHGDASKAQQALAVLGLVDAKGRWAAGAGVTLVQMGDLVDRGPDSLGTMALLHRLQDEAASAGSTVRLLLANHEQMNLNADFRYVAGEELHALGAREQQQGRHLGLSPAAAGAAAWAARWQVTDNAAATAGTGDGAAAEAANAAAAAAATATEVGDVRSAIARRHQLLAVEGAGTPCATAFVHAGLSPGVLHELLGLIAADGSPAGEQQVDAAPSQTQPQHHHRLHSGGGGTSPLQQHGGGGGGPVTAAQLAGINTAMQEAVAACGERLCVGGSLLQRRMWELLGSVHGPVWSRQQAQGAEAVVCQHVQQVLERLGVARLVLGHTPQEAGRATPRCGGRLLLLDTGMSAGMMDAPAAAWVCRAADGAGEAAGRPQVVYGDGLLQRLAV